MENKTNSTNKAFSLRDRLRKDSQFMKCLLLHISKLNNLTRTYLTS